MESDALLPALSVVLPRFGAITLALAGAVALIAIGSRTLEGQSVLPQTRAERTNYEETSRYDEVRGFIETLAAQTRRVRVETFGASEEGRPLPLLVVGDPPAAAPTPRSASSLPVVLVFANIHAGEVEGKEAALHIARRLTTGDLQPLLTSAVWLLAPIYNADGNERISLENRVEQNGPIGGVGTRENAKGLDLNRDFMKLDSVEARALVALMSRWDPDVVVDLHTTNGSYHGYHLTYAPPLSANTDERIVSFLRQRLLPSVRATMESRHRFRTFFYGNFATRESIDNEQDTLASAKGTPVWRTFDGRPRFGTNYIGLRNRMAILSEAYSYLDFAGRVRATEAFVEDIMRFVSSNGAEIRSLVTRVDDDMRRRGVADLGVKSSLRALDPPVEILVGAVEKKINPRSGKSMIAMVESAITPTKMLDYGAFAATARRAVPREYVMLATGDGLHERVASKLKEHGIRVDVIDSARPKVSVDRFVIDQVVHAPQMFQGHHETSITGRFEQRTIDVPIGSIVVRTDQPLGRLAFYLLEPESDDGLTTWNVLDAALKPGAAHPVIKVR